MDRVLEIWLAASRDGHRFIPAGYWRDRVEDMRTIYLPASETVVFTDEDSGRIEGFISCVQDYLAALFVAPRVQGRGIGTRLIEYAKQHRSSLELKVYTENRKATEFYKNQGFRIVRPEMDSDTGHPELVMLWRND